MSANCVFIRPGKFRQTPAQAQAQAQTRARLCIAFLVDVIGVDLPLETRAFCLLLLLL